MLVLETTKMAFGAVLRSLNQASEAPNTLADPPVTPLTAGPNQLV